MQVGITVVGGASLLDDSSSSSSTSLALGGGGATVVNAPPASAALLGMLNSCSSNVTVVNIDNGFGAGYVSSLINRL